MKKLITLVALLSLAIFAHPAPAFALTCPTGEQVLNIGYGDYCDGTKSLTGNETVPTQSVSSNPTDNTSASSWSAGAQCFTSFENQYQVSGTYDSKGNCITANGVGGNSAVNGGQVMNANGQFTTPTPTYTAAAPSTAASGNGQLSYTPLEPLPGDQGAKSYNSLSAYLTLMFNILLSLGAMIAVVSLVFAGITYMVSEVVDKKSAARRRINASFIGLGLLLTSYLILYTINPNLVKLCILNLDQQCGGNVTTGTGGNAVTANTANPTPAPSVLAAQEASCKKGGDLCAFNPTDGQPGVFQCDCAGI